MGGHHEELEGEVTGMWLEIKIHGLLSNTFYSVSVCAVTSVGCGPVTSVSSATRPPSCQSLSLGSISDYACYVTLL